MTTPPISAKINTSSSFSSYFSLLRPLNGVMAAIGTYLGYALGLEGFVFNLPVLYAMLAVFFISGGGQAINDYFDYASDVKQKSTRPIASGRISRSNGLLFSLLVFVLGIILASFLSPLSFAIAVFFSVLLVLYSAFMTRIKFFGNVVVALSVGFTYVFGASASFISPLVLMMALSGFFANWAREIMKDVEDVVQDAGYKITLPQLVSKNAVRLTTTVVVILGIIASYLPVIFLNVPFYYGIIATAGNVVFILALKELFKDSPKKAQSSMKKGMLAGLLAQLSLLVK